MNFLFFWFIIDICRKQGGDVYAKTAQMPQNLPGPQYESFSPEECPRESEAVTLTLDEYEVIRLVDLEKKTHEQCAAQMDISRTTVTEIYETARGKIARCIVLGQRLVIAGGNYRLCEGREHTRCGKCCCRKGSKQTPLTSLDLSQELPAADRFNSSLSKSNLQNEGDIIMKIAVTYENGEIFQHFGHTEAFKIYDIADGKVVNAEVSRYQWKRSRRTGWIPGCTWRRYLICGGIGGGA